MANRSSDKSASDGTCLKSLLTTISIAQIAGGTAHWWWDKLFPPELVVTQIPVETTETTDTIFVEGILEMIFPPWTTVYLEFVQYGDNVSCDFLYLLEKGTETIDAVFGGTRALKK